MVIFGVEARHACPWTRRDIENQSSRGFGDRARESNFVPQAPT
jgi:hypothetical protein